MNETFSRWQPIATAPTDSKEMFVVKGFNVTGYSKHPYTTDPYCVWAQRGNFVRWPHIFPPTHWMPLPPQPT